MVPTNKYSRPQPEKTYQRSEIAREQLKTATRLFLMEADDACVITLAGAASNILHQMVINEGKEPFNEYGRRVAGHIVGQMPKKSTYTDRINQILGINQLKHMKKDDPETIELDLRQCAINALTKAMADYSTLYGDKEDFVHAFFQWAWVNLDGPSIMKQFKDAPKQFKK